MNLEQKLSKLEWRPAPASWRREIMMYRPTGVFSVFWRNFWDVLYPGPRLAITLAVVWAIILWLHLHTPGADLPPGMTFSMPAYAAAQQERAQILFRITTLEDPGDTAEFRAPLRLRRKEG